MTMLAARLHGPRDLRVEAVEESPLAQGAYRLRVRAVGICGSDLHYYLDGGIGTAVVSEPFIPGHEFAAEIIDAPDCEASLPVGTLVAVDPARPCGRCEWCRRGHVNLCPYVAFAGAPPHPGALAEYFHAPAETLFPVPAGFDATTAALLEPLGVAIHALDLARLRPLESVCVLGAGAIGLLLLQVARASGAGDVYVIDPLEYRAHLAAELGATAVAPRHEAVLDWTNGRGVDVVLEATDAPSGPQHAAEAVAIGGRVILVGIPAGDRFELGASLVRRKGLTIKLSRRMGHVYPRAIKMVAEGRVRLAPLATHRIPLAEAPQAFARQASHQDGVIKTIVEP
jgi:L-iditol 2-dehydrogenase